MTRITRFGDGQFEVDDELLQRLNELADRAVEALERVDETSLG